MPPATECPFPLPEALPKDRLLRWFRHEKNERQSVAELHHANTVLTSLTFAKLGGLVSRSRAVAENHPQTEQYTDDDDRVFGIFDKLFLDPLDIHEQKYRRNLYGPVTFVFDVALLELECVREVRVTRKNPSKLKHLPTNEQRWLAKPTDLTARFDPKSYDNHVVLTCDANFLPFAPYLRRVILTDPQTQMPSGADAFQPAFEALER